MRDLESQVNRKLANATDWQRNVNGVGMKPYRVLCLDGGGMRGIYTAAFLDRISNQYARLRGMTALDVGLGFDLIVGTSTGAIVAAGLAAGIPMTKVVDLYAKHGEKIFPHRITGPISAIKHGFKGRKLLKSGEAELRVALEEVLGTITMAEVFVNRGVSLAIPAVRMNTHKAWVFKKTPSSGVRDDNYPLVDVCIATSAAPIYRSLAAIDNPDGMSGGKEVFADGGLWANNPILVGLIDALQNAPAGQAIELYSLGTCPRPEGEHIDDEKVHRTIGEWWMGAKVAPLSIAAQESAFNDMARMLSNSFTKLGRQMSTIRFPQKAVPASMMDFLGLDDARETTRNRLIQQAHIDADLTKSACDDEFNAEGRMIRNIFEEIPEMDEKNGWLATKLPIQEVNDD